MFSQSLAKLDFRCIRTIAAIIVGEETGATRCGAGGMVATIELPHTGIVVNFSTAKYLAEISDTSISHGVKPDVPYDVFIKGS